MRTRLLITLVILVTTPFVFAFGQGITLERVDGIYGAPDDSALIADGSTPIIFYLRLTGTSQVSGGLTAGVCVRSTDGAQWGSTVADTLDVGTPWGTMFDDIGGFFINHFGVSGSAADTVAFGALAIHNGLPASFDAESFKITIGPISSEHDGKTICLDSCFYPPHGYWILAGSGGSFAWGGPYTFTLVNPTDVNEPGSGLPRQFALSQNSPNPFNPTTEIHFDVPSKSHVNLAVYNLLGRRVRLLLDEERAAGSYVLTWDGRGDNGESLSSGVYFYKMQTATFTQTRKALLVK
ncbi:MAG: T9SS type A sorting domain-containing protein [Candidatus Zixiibacteriota bacterium]|nr:MAG: T9SS type A sorting domain-containing protein [candidate division Zixibacteria bacterium]